MNKAGTFCSPPYGEVRFRTLRTRVTKSSMTATVISFFKPDFGTSQLVAAGPWNTEWWSAKKAAAQIISGQRLGAKTIIDGEHYVGSVQKICTGKGKDPLARGKVNSINRKESQTDSGMLLDNRRSVEWD